MSIASPILTDSKTSSIRDLIKRQKVYFATGATKEAAFRIKQLKKLKQMILDNESTFLKALHADLRKCETEGYLTEIGFVLADIDDAISHIKGWMRPRPVPTPMFHAIGSSKIHSDPYGTVLIIAPWNYPFQLLLAPLVGAIAAGNTAVLKPSEYAEETSKALFKVISSTFSDDYIGVVEGAVEETTVLLEERFDYIFFTGSTFVGRIVYQAAAKHLTPVTLELGGKSPCIVGEKVDIDIAAKRIAWGKLINAGQTCIAPDYVLVHESRKAELVDKLKSAMSAFYGENASESPDYCRIINEKHFDRIERLMDSGDIIYGGKTDKSDKYIAPTLVDNVDPSEAIMQEEIFGPVLPILTYTDFDEAVRFVNSREKPLALYFFSKNKKRIDQIIEQTSSGGVAINDTVMHIGNPYLPFGGVGESGIGAYHGQSSFDTFSHQKSVLYKRFKPDLKIRYAPYAGNFKTLKTLMKYFNK